MAEAKEKAATKTVPVETEGLVGSWVATGAELAETALSTVFQAVREVNDETHERFVSVVDVAGGTLQGVARVVRGIGGHVHSVFEAALDAGEKVTVGTVRTVHKVAQDVTGLASKASASLVQAGEQRLQRAA